MLLWIFFEMPKIALCWYYTNSMNRHVGLQRQSLPFLRGGTYNECNKICISESYGELLIIVIITLLFIVNLVRINYYIVCMNGSGTIISSPALEKFSGPALQGRTEFYVEFSLYPHNHTNSKQNWFCEFSGDIESADDSGFKCLFEFLIIFIKKNWSGTPFRTPRHFLVPPGRTIAPPRL